MEESVPTIQYHYLLQIRLTCSAQCLFQQFRGCSMPPKRQPTFSRMPIMNGLKPYYQTQPFHVRSWGHLLFSTDTAIAFYQWWLLTDSGDCWGDKQATEIKNACSTSLGSAECSGGLGSDVALFALMVPVQTKVRFLRTLDRGRWLPNKVATEPPCHPHYCFKWLQMHKTGRGLNFNFKHQV